MKPILAMVVGMTFWMAGAAGAQTEAIADIEATTSVVDEDAGTFTAESTLVLVGQYDSAQVAAVYDCSHTGKTLFVTPFGGPASGTAECTAQEGSIGPGTLSGCFGGWVGLQGLSILGVIDGHTVSCHGPAVPTVDEQGNRSRSQASLKCRVFDDARVTPDVCS